MVSQKEFVCTVCPVGCRLTVSQAEDGEIVVRGNTCKRGARYGRDEFVDPQRTVTSSVWVEGGDLPLVSVRTQGSVSKAKIPEVLQALKRCKVCAPVHVGDVIIPHVAGTDTNVVATRNVRKK